MNRRIVTIGIIVVVIAAASVAFLVFREPEEASGTLEAIPLEITPNEEPAAEDLAEEPAAEKPVTEEAVTEEPVSEETVTETPQAITEAEPTEEPTPEPTEAPAEQEPAGRGLVVFRINPGGSRVRFELNEELRGQPKTVVGVTDQIAGELAVDFTDLSATQVGVIQINARTLATDNNFRNRAINNQILDTGAHEFITFTPTDVEGLPESVAPGDTVNFSINGDLTIRDITRPVTFEVEATAVSEDQITGTASAVVTRSDYNLVIPSVPGVANVEEEVELYIDFAAVAV